MTLLFFFSVFLLLPSGHQCLGFDFVPAESGEAPVVIVRAALNENEQPPLLPPKAEARTSRLQAGDKLIHLLHNMIPHAYLGHTTSV
jgi:hypothetical protein